MITSNMEVITHQLWDELYIFVASTARALNRLFRGCRRSPLFPLVAIAGGAVLGIVAIKLIALLGAAFDISLLRDVGNNVTSGGAAGGLGAGVGGGAGGGRPPVPAPEPTLTPPPPGEGGPPNPPPPHQGPFAGPPNTPPHDGYYDQYPHESDYKGLTPAQVHERLCQELGIKWSGCN